MADPAIQERYLQYGSELCFSLQLAFPDARWSEVRQDHWSGNAVVFEGELNGGADRIKIRLGNHCVLQVELWNASLLAGEFALRVNLEKDNQHRLDAQQAERIVIGTVACLLNCEIPSQSEQDLTRDLIVEACDRAFENDSEEDRLDMVEAGALLEQLTNG